MIIKRFINGKPVVDTEVSQPLPSVVDTGKNSPKAPIKSPIPNIPTRTPAPTPSPAPKKRGCGCGRK
jgi:hypothetical protein